MKTFLTFILLLFLLSNSTYYVDSYCVEQEEVYGLIKDNAVLLDTAFLELTSLPSTYFVIIISEIDSHYYVEYANLYGFIEKKYVEKVDYEPKYKFHNAYFLAKNDTFPSNIRRSPTLDSEIISSIPNSSSAFLYGSIRGDDFYSLGSDLWYYVKYSSFYGYVYGLHGVADQIPENVIEKVVKEEQKTPDTPQKEFNVKWFYVLLVALPALVIMFALFSKKGNNLDQPESNKA